MERFHSARNNQVNEKIILLSTKIILYSFKTYTIHALYLFCKSNIVPTQGQRHITTLRHGKAGYDYRKLNCSDLGYITAALF